MALVFRFYFTPEGGSEDFVEVVDPFLEANSVWSKFLSQIAGLALVKGWDFGTTQLHLELGLEARNRPGFLYAPRQLFIGNPAFDFDLHMRRDLYPATGTLEYNLRTTYPLRVNVRNGVDGPLAGTAFLEVPLVEFGAAAGGLAEPLVFMQTHLLPALRDVSVYVPDTADLYFQNPAADLAMFPPMDPLLDPIWLPVVEFGNVSLTPGLEQPVVTLVAPHLNTFLTFGFFGSPDLFETEVLFGERFREVQRRIEADPETVPPSFALPGDDPVANLFFSESNAGTTVLPDLVPLATLVDEVQTNALWFRVCFPVAVTVFEHKGVRADAVSAGTLAVDLTGPMLDLVPRDLLVQQLAGHLTGLGDFYVDEGEVAVHGPAENPLTVPVLEPDMTARRPVFEVLETFEAPRLSVFVERTVLCRRLVLFARNPTFEGFFLGIAAVIGVLFVIIQLGGGPLLAPVVGLLRQVVGIVPLLGGALTPFLEQLQLSLEE